MRTNGYLPWILLLLIALLLGPLLLRAPDEGSILRPQHSLRTSAAQEELRDAAAGAPAAPLDNR